MTEIVRYRGDTWPIEMTVLKDDLPMDITGCTFLLTVDPAKSPVDNTNNLFELTGSIVGDPVDGVIAFEPTEEQVDHIGNYYYDLQVTDSSLKKRTIAKDRFKFVQDITKI